ncbi:hypothetical protein STENM223S_00565 [Streptomyces tendae]
MHGGRRPALRLLRDARGAADPLPAHAAVQVPRLRLSGVAPGTLMAYDGELTETEGDLTLEKLPEALTVPAAAGRRAALLTPFLLPGGLS